MQRIIFGRAGGDHVQIALSGYTREPAGDVFSDDSVNVEVTVVAGGFRAIFAATFLAVELIELDKDLRVLHDALKGRVVFETFEGQLRLVFTADRLGHIVIEGSARDHVSSANTLAFSIDTDQTDLARSLDGLTCAIGIYPSRAGAY